MTILLVSARSSQKFLRASGMTERVRRIMIKAALRRPETAPPPTRPPAAVSPNVISQT